MSLTKLQVRNYLRAKKFNINLDPHITTLIGKSAIGKSSIIRGLRWLCQNKPSGTNFINWDAKTTSVGIIVDKKKVIRKRSKAINLYKLNNQTYKSFKSNIPSSIDKLLNVLDINFQSQHDPHFWFSLSPAEVGRQLNQIVSLELIDSSQKKIASKIRHTKTEVSIHQKEIKQVKSTLQDTRYIITINKTLTALETCQNTISRTTQQDAILSDLVSRAIKYRAQQNNAEIQANQAKLALSTGRQAGVVQNRADLLETLLKRARKLRVLLTIKITNIDNLSTLKSKIDNNKEQYNILTTLFGKAEQWEEAIYQENLKTKQAEAKLKRLIKGRCPLCNRPFKRMNKS